MIVFFDGPDQTKKSTLLKTASQILNVPMWERAAFLPHHGRLSSKGMHTPDSIWYTIDELKTIRAFKKLGGNMIIDRHPLVSELVYRRVEGVVSMLEYAEHDPSEEFVILCFNGGKDKFVVDQYRRVLNERQIDFMSVDTSDGEKALQGIVLFLHQVLPSVSGLSFYLR